MDSQRPSAPPPLCLAVLGGCVALLAGCSGNAERPVYKLSGRLTYEGRPMNKAYISFYSVDPTDRGIAAHGTADGDGRSTVQTYRKDDGAPAGECVVTIVWPGKPKKKPNPDDPDQDEAAPDQLKGAYSRADTTKLRATVRKEANTVDFNLP